jgi:hypothetical protein
MDFLTFLTLVAVGAWGVNRVQQRARITLLASHLGQFQIEKRMQELTDGYLRCLGESDPARREQIWLLLAGNEQALSGQFERFANGFSKVGEVESRVSRLALSLPWAQQLLPQACFDLRALLALHARGIANVARNALGQSDRDKAFMMTAELFLMQHSCHWFCKSRAVASARLLARHKTSYEQVLAAVAPATRRDYRALTGI